MATRPVFQFKITLQDIEPQIWRRIQISDLCTFWDLHVAIQNAMGWTDSHLHLFKVNHSLEKGKVYIGIPDEEYIDDDTLPGWYHKVKDYLIINEQFFYEYDFGDCWGHYIEYEGLQQKQKDMKYPVCISGERACPPEDVGGTHGYEDFIHAITAADNENHDSLLEWIGGAYDPENFNAQSVKFQSPKKRWRQVFNREPIF